MARLFRKSFLLNLIEASDDLALEVPDRHVALFWPTLFTISFAYAALSVWLFTVKLPVTVEARGLVMPRGGVREIISFGQGLVRELPTGNSSFIRAGDILMEILTPSAEETFTAARKSYLLEQAYLKAQRNAGEQDLENRLKALSLQLDNVRENRMRLQTISISLEQAVLEYDATAGEMLQTQRQGARDITKIYDEMLEGAAHLREQGVLSNRDYLQFLQGKTLAHKSLSDVVTEISRSNVEQNRMRRELSEISEKIEVDQVREQEILGAISDARNKWNSELQGLALREAESRNQLLEADRALWFQTHVLAPYDGTLIATKKRLGQTLAQGETVGLMKLSTQHRKLMLVISPYAETGWLTLALRGHRAEVLYRKGDPDFRNRLRGALLSMQPGASFDLYSAGNRFVIERSGRGLGPLAELDIVKDNLADGSGVPAFAMLVPVGDQWYGGELEMIALLQIQDAKRVEKGAQVRVKPDFEKSLIGTQISARVWQVSDYVSTSVEAQSLVGSTEIAQALIGNQSGVATIIRFERDETGNLHLNGDTLSRSLTAGTTARATIQVGTETPIGVLWPFYARLFGK